MKTNEEVAANLERAKQILQTRGRTTGTLYNTRTGRCCPLGAVGLAVVGDRLIEELPFVSVYDHFGPDGEAYPEVEALANNIPAERRRGDYAMVNVYRFNDFHADLGDEGDRMVFDLIDRTIESLK